MPTLPIIITDKFRTWVGAIRRKEQVDSKKLLDIMGMRCSSIVTLNLKRRMISITNS